MAGMENSVMIFAMALTMMGGHFLAAAMAGKYCTSSVFCMLAYLERTKLISNPFSAHHSTLLTCTQCICILYVCLYVILGDCFNCRY